jgi:hypothetical protein
VDVSGVVGGSGGVGGGGHHERLMRASCLMLGGGDVRDEPSCLLLLVDVSTSAVCSVRPFRQRCMKGGGGVGEGTAKRLYPRKP